MQTYGVNSLVCDKTPVDHRMRPYETRRSDLGSRATNPRNRPGTMHADAAARAPAWCRRHGPRTISARCPSPSAPSQAPHGCANPAAWPPPSPKRQTGVKPLGLREQKSSQRTESLLHPQTSRTSSPHITSDSVKFSNLEAKMSEWESSTNIIP